VGVDWRKREVTEIRGNVKFVLADIALLRAANHIERE
jgi:hypothetical protein